MRSPGFMAACPTVNGYGGGGSPETAPAPAPAQAPLNIHAKEFQPVGGPAGGGDGGSGGSPARNPPPLLRSKSSKDARALKVGPRGGGVLGMDGRIKRWGCLMRLESVGKYVVLVFRLKGCLTF